MGITQLFPTCDTYSCKISGNKTGNHKSILTQDMFSVQFEFEYSNVEIFILLGNELVIYLEND